MDKNFFDKLQKEQSLTATESLELDNALAETERIGDAVRLLDSEEASLAWRSQLNERLIQVAKPQRSTSAWLRWIPATAVAASALGVAILLTRPAANNSMPVVAPSAEEQILVAHFASDGLSAEPVNIASKPVGKQTEEEVVYWSEGDLGS